MNLIDSHDTPHALTVLNGNRSRLKLAAALQMAYPGVPMLYAGDEAGLEGSFAEDGRRCYPWGHEDQDLLTFYRTAIHARRASPAISLGEVETAWIDPQGGYGFFRFFKDECVLALFNNSEKSLVAAVNLGRFSKNCTWRDLLSETQTVMVQSDCLQVELPPLGAAWLTAGL